MFSNCCNMYGVKCMVILAAFVAIVANEILDQKREKMKEQAQPKCSLFYYSSTCFKLDLLRLMVHLGRMSRINLMSGITLLSTEKTKRLANELELATQTLPNSDLDKFLWASALEYISSLNVTMRLDQSSVLYDIKSFSEDVWSGRGKKGKYAIGALAVVAFGLLATLVGKALMASMLALFMSLLRGAQGAPGLNNFNSPPSAYGLTVTY
ncbi:uncharacterized protein isoform X2 [Rhodnius prolixus]|uniref:uncharacterized protein isoform X2 n=1 Tax=Rhodnius prolixus TaxID=13249 RepID=UPI003D1893DC